MSKTAAATRPSSKREIARNLIRALHSVEGVPPELGDLSRALDAVGLSMGDARLKGVAVKLAGLDPRTRLTEEVMIDLLEGAEAALVERALAGALVIPDFADFTNRLGEIFEFCRSDRGGEVARYIPQLAQVDPEKFAMGLCSIDGQRFSVGDDSDRFCVQSTCKPINYAIAHGLTNSANVHRHIGREPSGRSFNELTLNPAGLPHNPMINAGAIMAASLIKPDHAPADRFDYVMGKWRDLGGGTEASFDNAVFLSEKATADRNFALAYFMRENGAFPPNTNLMETLDFYFQCCSICVDVRQMSVIAATLANGGICPITNQRVLEAEAVRNCLSLMYSCGMYDFSGEFAFTVGIPAKSGVSGALMLVVPGVCGIAIWSPRLDRCGNSVRGVQIAERLAKTFTFHSYSTMVDGQTLIDPTSSQLEQRGEIASALCSAAHAGDLGEIRRLIAAGADVTQSDYDGRTALHLAACEGCEELVKFLLSVGCDPKQKDRWGNTALDDAVREKRDGIVSLLSPEVKPGLKPIKRKAA